MSMDAPAAARRGPRPAFDRLLRALVVLVGVAVMARPLAVAGLGRLRTLFGALGPRIALVLLPFPIGITLEAMGWQRILRAMGARVPVWSLLRIRLGTEAVTRGLPGGNVASEVTKP